MKQEPCIVNEDPYQSMQWDLKSDAPFTTGGYNLQDIAKDSSFKHEIPQEPTEETDTTQLSDESFSDKDAGDVSVASIPADKTVLTESSPIVQTASSAAKPATSENNRVYKVSLKKQGRRPHKCENCDIFFSTLDNYHIHMRTHKSSGSTRR